MVGGVHRRGPGRRLRRPAADGLGPAGRRDQDARALAAGARRGQARGRPGRRGRGRAASGRRVDAAEQVIVEYDPQARGGGPREGARGRLAAGVGGVRHQQDPRVGGRAAATSTPPRRGRGRGRAARGQPPHLGRPDRAARLDRRAARRERSRSTRPPRSRTSRASCSPGSLGIPEDKLRVVAPDVGGGFGAKLQVYAEEALVLALAKRLGRPVKWTETRSEHMTTTHHGRDQIAYVTLTAKRDGTVTGLQGPGSWPTWAPTSSCSRRSSRSSGFPVIGRLLQVPGDRPPLHGRLHEQDAHRRHPRRGPARRPPTGSS